MLQATRRTQQERRDATRAVLLNAALSTLCEGGLARFTTPEVCARAGMSQGALFRYFPTKATLLAATTEHLFLLLRDEYEARFRRLPPRERSLQGGTRLLWRSMQDPRLAAAFELFAAARTDAALHKAVEPIVRAHVEHIRMLARTLLPGRSGLGDEEFDATLELIILSMQGLVLQEMVAVDSKKRERVLRALQVLVARPSGETPS
jgi:AcrR family transcriptional regulator